MTKTYLLNAIPGALVPPTGAVLVIQPVRPEEIGAAVRDGACLSAIGHADTAALVSALIGAPVPMARVSVPALSHGDVHFLALYQGPRLPEGSVVLPEGATVAFFRLAAADPAQAQANMAHEADYPVAGGDYLRAMMI